MRHARSPASKIQFRAGDQIGYNWPCEKSLYFSKKKKREHFARLGWQVNSIYIHNQCWRTIWPLGINHSIQTVLVKGKDTTEKGKDTTGDIFALSNRIHIWKILNRSLIDSALSVKMINMC